MANQGGASITIRRDGTRVHRVRSHVRFPATRGRILSLICLEAVVIGLGGGLIGILVGHALSGVGSAYLQQTVGEGINWMKIDPQEWAAYHGLKK